MAFCNTTNTNSSNYAGGILTPTWVACTTSASLTFLLNVYLLVALAVSYRRKRRFRLRARLGSSGRKNHQGDSQMALAMAFACATTILAACSVTAAVVLHAFGDSLCYVAVAAKRAARPLHFFFTYGCFWMRQRSAYGNPLFKNIASSFTRFSSVASAAIVLAIPVIGISLGVPSETYCNCFAIASAVTYRVIVAIVLMRVCVNVLLLALFVKPLMEHKKEFPALSYITPLVRRTVLSSVTCFVMDVGKAAFVKFALRDSDEAPEDIFVVIYMSAYNIVAITTFADWKDILLLRSPVGKRRENVVVVNNTSVQERRGRTLPGTPQSSGEW